MKGTEKSETDLHWVYRYLKDGDYPPGLTATEKRIVRKRAERFCFLNDELIFLGTIQAKEHGVPSRKVLLTRAERLEVVGVAHIDKEGNHNGLERTVDSVSAAYYWVGIYKFVKDYIRACTTCRAIRPRLGTGRDVEPTSSTEVERLDSGSKIGVDYPSQTTSPSMEVESGQEVEAIQEEDNEPKSKCFWDLVDLRLFGPYRVGTVLKYILVVLDVYSLWPEAFVLESISQTTVVHVLLKLISRYGRMNAVVVSGDDEILETAVNDALLILQQAISFKVMLHRILLKVTDNHYIKLEDTLEAFVKKYPKNWSDCLELWLLPLRTNVREQTDASSTSATPVRDSQQPAGFSPRAGPSHLNDVDTAKVIELLMQANQTDNTEDVTMVLTIIETEENDDAQDSPPSPMPCDQDVLSPPKAGIVTRSRTGHSKPKDLGKEHVYPGKRKASVVTDTPVTKQTKVEQEDNVTPIEEAEAVSDTESDISTLENSKMKIAVGLDDYYSAVLQYIKGSGYPANSSPSFKRLIRDISKHYLVKDQTLYHVAGKSSTQLKRVIMTYPERHRLLRVAHESDGDEFHYPASAMLAKLRNAHWKGKGVDCDAFVLACIYCDSAERKFKDVPPPLERKLLTRDTFETYKEIKYYLKHEQFSNESVATRLDDLLKLIKKFRLEDGSLFHVVSNRRLSLLTSASDRLEAIKLSHLLKGTHADEKGTLKQLSENYYWFGVATDVRVYTNLCCGNGDWRHLIDRYFKFREFNMNISLSDVPVNLPYTPMRRPRVKLEKLDNSIAKEMEELLPYLQMEEPTIDCVEVNIEATPASPVNATVSEDDSNMKPPGISVASVANTEEETCDKPTGEDSTHTEVNLEEIEVITDTSDVVTEPPNVAEEPEIVRKITPQVVAVRVSEEGNVVSSKPPVAVPGSRTQDAATQRLLSDPITMAAVKSILPEDCIMCAEIDLQVVPAVAKKTKEVKSDVNPVDGAHNTSDKPDLRSTGPVVPSVEVVVPSLPCVLPGALNSGETDQRNLVVSLNEDTDSDDSQQLDTDEEENSLFGEIEVTQDGVPKLVTNTPLQGAQVLKVKDSLLHRKGEGNFRGPVPRPHYRCTVCNKVFHGEIKFKIHMYKHTGLKPFHCEQCDKKYTNNKSLALHMKVHTGDLHFLCSVCGKATVSKTALKSHLKSHLSPGGGSP